MKNKKILSGKRLLVFNVYLPSVIFGFIATWLMMGIVIEPMLNVFLPCQQTLCFRLDAVIIEFVLWIISILVIYKILYKINIERK